MLKLVSVLPWHEDCVCCPRSLKHERPLHLQTNKDQSLFSPFDSVTSQEMFNNFWHFKHRVGKDHYISLKRLYISNFVGDFTEIQSVFLEPLQNATKPWNYAIEMP